MWDSYVYRKPAHRHRLATLKKRLGIVLLVLLLGALIYAAISWDLGRSKKPAVSEKQTVALNNGLQTFRSTYFQFQDSGKWVLKTSESNSGKYVFYKYRGLAVEHQLIVYINQVPIPLYLAVARAVPVRIVNNNSLDATSVTGPCGNTYGVGELHKVKIVSLNGADMLCDPDTPQFSVVLAEIGGNYQFTLHRISGTPIKFVITYRDLRLNPGPDTILQVANSFQAL